jgi:hypothetical protein
MQLFFLILGVLCHLFTLVRWVREAIWGDDKYYASDTYRLVLYLVMAGVNALGIMFILLFAFWEKIN